MLPRPTLEAFDAWLSARGLQLEATVVGGTALVLLGVTERQTRDVDILAPALTPSIREAARDFAQSLRAGGQELADDWLNNGPSQLAAQLPSRWPSRRQPVFEGAALTLMALGRSDLLKTKLFALCDRGTDLADCVALAPTPHELAAAEPWVTAQDSNPGWPDHVQGTFAALQARLGHGI